MQVERYSLLEKLEPLPIKVRPSEQADILAGLSEVELRMRVDLRPFMQRTPFVIQVTCLSDFRAPEKLFVPEGSRRGQRLLRRVTPAWRARTGCSAPWGSTTCWWALPSPTSWASSRARYRPAERETADESAPHRKTLQR